MGTRLWLSFIVAVSYDCRLRQPRASRGEDRAGNPKLALLAVAVIELSKSCRTGTTASGTISV